jgi:EmrB/QacA subfamily drug resistance transporter
MTPTQRKALLAVILGSGVVFLDGSVVNLALPKMADMLHAGFTGQQWVVDGYLLTLSALILLGGSLGDILGRKLIYMWGVAGFGIASLLCAVSPNIEVLVASRLLQGVFGAMMVPGALALINTNFSAELRGKAIGQWTAATSGIIAAGPLVGGYLIDTLSWRWIFLINVPLLLLVVWLGRPSIKETRVITKRSIDWLGATLAVVGLGGVTYGLIEGPANHWALEPVAALVAGLLGFVFFLWWENRRKDPMLSLGLFKSHNFTAANVSTFAMYGALGGFFFILTIYLQTTLHYSSIAAGLTALPVTIMMILLSGRIGGLSGKFGPRWFMTAGPIMAGLGILTLLPLQEGSSYVWNILPGITLFGLGLATTVAPLTTTVLASVKEEDSGIASAVNNAVSRVSGLFVVAVLGIFGAGNAYRFAVLLCGGLAISAGILAALLVRNQVRAVEKPTV